MFPLQNCNKVLSQLTLTLNSKCFRQSSTCGSKLNRKETQEENCIIYYNISKVVSSNSSFLWKSSKIAADKLITQRSSKPCWHISCRQMSFFSNHLACFSSSSNIEYYTNSSRKSTFSAFLDPPVLFNVHVRRFKTQRSIDTDRLRHPPLTDRIITALGLKSSFLPSQDYPGKLNTDNREKEIERLKVLLNNENLTSEEKQRIVIAFAEGYKISSPKRRVRWKEVLYDAIVVSIILTIAFATFTGLNPGSMPTKHVKVNPEEINVTFDDVKGVDLAKEELKNVVEFLKRPEKFSSLGGKLPKGILLVGPPGTGKTMLARAVAGEAGVPFFHATGSGFEGPLVGLGSKRVHSLFKAAKEEAPCIIFIDEIDSIGRKRTHSSQHPYANEAINQLLAEMDGFYQNAGVIVLAATNRKEALDTALLRPGRFDVEVNISAPDYTGRKEILELYLEHILHKNIDVNILARSTTGFTGADLENLVNQAAIQAASDKADSVTMKYLENARDKILMGPEHKCRIPDEEANLITAYHEGGHATVAYYTKGSHSLHKVTILHRGHSLGHTAYIQEKEQYLVTKLQMLAMMDTLMGGRAAEELIFGPDKITSGASNDLMEATSIATQIVKHWGMSEKVGLCIYENTNHLSHATREQIDHEIKRIMMESYERAKKILKTHRKEHKLIAEALLKYETLNAKEIKDIMMGKILQK